MRNRKFSLDREKDTDVYVSNWKILGYALPSIGIFLILAAFIVDPYIAYWSTILLAWWLVPIIIISYIVLFIIIGCPYVTVQTTYKYSDNLRFIQKQRDYLTIWQIQWRRESFQYGISMPNVFLTLDLLRTE